MDRETESKQVLIIGEHSYIGNRLAKELEKRQIHTEMAGAKNGDWKRVELVDYHSVVIVAAIVHKKEREEELYKKINRDMPIQAAKRAKAAGVRQVVF